MALRTSEALVKGVIETDADIRLAPFIRTANALTNWLATADAADEALLGADLLLEIETYLAAHFYEHSRDPNYQSKSTGGASGSFTGQTAMVLMATRPGQIACLMDVSGKLAQRSKEAQEGLRNRAQAFWAGTEYSDDGTFVTD